MDAEQQFEAMTQPHLLAAWKDWRDKFQDVDDHARCPYCRDQWAFCDCGQRMAYRYLEREHCAEEEVIIVATIPTGPSSVTVPAGGKFGCIYYDAERMQHFAVIHHPISVGGSVVTTEAHGGPSSLDVGFPGEDGTTP